MEDLKQIQEFFSKPLEENTWPEELTSRYSDEYRFELEKVTPTYQDKPGRAKYRVIDIESGELKGTPVFGSISSLQAFADDLIKPQGGTQSTNLGEMDINDPVLMKMRAAKNSKPDFGKEYGDAVKTAYGNDKNAKKIAFLKKERAQLMRDMEQEAEPEGGPIADEYGSKLNRIDAAIAKLSGRKEMTYDQAIAEGTLTQDELASYRDNAMEKLANADIVDKKLGKTRQGDKYIMVMYKEKWDFANPPKTGMYNPETQWVKVFYNDESEIQDLMTLKETKVVNEELNLSNYGKVTPPKGGASLVGKYNSIQGKSKYDTVIFDYQEGSDKPYGIVQVEGHGIYGSDLLKRLGLRQTRSWTAGVDVYIHDGNNTPVYVSEGDFKALLDFWSGGLDREAKAQADFYRGRGNTSGTIDENLNPEVHRLVNAFVRKMADRYDYSLQDAVYAILEVLRSQNYSGLNEAKEEDSSTYEQRMINQIKRAKKDGVSMFKLPTKTQEYYRKNKSKFEQDVNETSEEDKIDIVTMDVPLFIRVLEYAREDAQEDMDLHDLAEKAISSTKQQGILQMDDYDMLVGETEPIDESVNLKQSKNYIGKKQITKDEFANLKNKTITYDGGEWNVMDSNEFTIEIKNKDGDTKIVNYTQFTKKGLVERILKKLKENKIK